MPMEVTEHVRSTRERKKSRDALIISCHVWEIGQVEAEPASWKCQFSSRLLSEQSP